EIESPLGLDEAVLVARQTVDEADHLRALVLPQVLRRPLERHRQGVPPRGAFLDQAPVPGGAPLDQDRTGPVNPRSLGGGAGGGRLIEGESACGGHLARGAPPGRYERGGFLDGSGHGDLLGSLRAARLPATSVWAQGTRESARFSVSLLFPPLLSLLERGGERG